MMTYTELMRHWLMLVNAFNEHNERLLRWHAMGDKPTLTLATSEPPPAMEQTLLRLRADAHLLHNEMTAAQARASLPILEKVHADVAALIYRAEFKR